MTKKKERVMKVDDAILIGIKTRINSFKVMDAVFSNEMLSYVNSELQRLGLDVSKNKYTVNPETGVISLIEERPLNIKNK